MQNNTNFKINFANKSNKKQLENLQKITLFNNADCKIKIKNCKKINKLKNDSKNQDNEFTINKLSINNKTNSDAPKVCNPALLSFEEWKNDFDVSDTELKPMLDPIEEIVPDSKMIGCIYKKHKKPFANGEKMFSQLDDKSKYEVDDEANVAELLLRDYYDDYNDGQQNSVKKMLFRSAGIGADYDLSID